MDPCQRLAARDVRRVDPMTPQEMADAFWSDGSLRGQTLGGYQFIEKISHKSTGILYKGSDVRLGRWVILKLLPSLLVGDAESKRRLLREAQCLSALDHPNIVKIHHINEREHALFLVMEY